LVKASCEEPVEEEAAMETQMMGMEDKPTPTLVQVKGAGISRTWPF